MTRFEALKELAAKVEAGTVSGETEDHDLARIVCCDAGDWLDLARAYMGSLDAARALHEAVLPGWRCILCMTYPDATASVFEVNPDQSHTVGGHLTIDVTSPAPARAWLLAILRALIAQEESK